MALSFVTSFKNASGGTLTGLTAGQLVVVYAFRSGSNSKPTLPAGWTADTAGVTSNSAGSLIAHQLATGTSLVTGTFTSATNCIFLVFDGVDQTTPVGDSAVTTNIGTTVTYPALTMVVTNGTSWVAGLGGHRSTNTTIDTAPTGMTNRDSQITTGETSVNDTNGGVSSWALVNQSVGGTSSGWGCYSLEIIAAASGTSASVTQVAATVTATGGTQAVASVNNISVAQVAANVITTGGTQVVTTATYASVTQVAATLTATGGAQGVDSNVSIVDATADQQATAFSCGQRKIAHNSTGRLFAAYRKKNGATYEPYVAYSDNGLTWTPVLVANITTDNQRVPSIYVDSSDIVHLVWYGKDPSNTGTNQRQIKYSQSTDNGATWSAWISVGGDVTGYAAGSFWQEHPTIIADPSNASNLYCVWEGADSVNANQMVKFSKSTNGGTTWSAWANIGPKGSRPDIAMTSNGNLHVIYYSSLATSGTVNQIQHVISTNTGTTWSAAVIINDSGIEGRMGSIVADGTSVHCVWRAKDATYTTTQIQYSKYTGTWSAATPLAPSIGNYEFFPQIGLASSKPTVVWETTPDASSYPTEAPLTGEIYWSQLSGGTWSTALALTNSDYNFYPNIDRDRYYTLFESGLATPWNVEFVDFTGGAVNATVAQVAALVTATGGTQTIATVNNIAITQAAAVVTAAGGTQSVNGVNNIAISQVAAAITATCGTQAVAVIVSASVTQVAATVTATCGTQVVATSNVVAIAQVAAVVTAQGGTQNLQNVQSAAIFQVAATVTATGGTQAVLAGNSISIAQVAATITATGGTQTVLGTSFVSIAQVAATITATGGTQVIAARISTSIAQVAAVVTATGGTQAVLSASNASIAQVTANVTATGGVQASAASNFISISQVAANITATGGTQSIVTTNSLTISQVAANVIARGGTQGVIGNVFVSGAISQVAAMLVMSGGVPFVETTAGPPLKKPTQWTDNDPNTPAQWTNNDVKLPAQWTNNDVKLPTPWTAH